MSEYVVARTVAAATALEVKETALFTAAAIWSDLDIRAATIIPAMYPLKFSRDEYPYDGDVIARLTRKKKP